MCVFVPFIRASYNTFRLSVPHIIHVVGTTLRRIRRGHTGVSTEACCFSPPSYCGACLDFYYSVVFVSRQKLSYRHLRYTRPQKLLGGGQFRLISVFVRSFAGADLFAADFATDHQSRKQKVHRKACVPHSSVHLLLFDSVHSRRRWRRVCDVFRFAVPVFDTFNAAEFQTTAKATTI